MSIVMTKHDLGGRDFVGAMKGDRITLADGESASPGAGLYRIYAITDCTIRFGSGVASGAGGEPWPAGRLETRYLASGEAIAVAPTENGPTAWADGNSARDMRSFATVEFQVASLAAGVSIAVTRSLDAANFAAQTGINTADLSTVTSITANGIYAFSGGGFVKWTKTGPGAAPTVTIRGSN